MEGAQEQALSESAHAVVHTPQPESPLLSSQAIPPAAAVSERRPSPAPAASAVAVKPSWAAAVSAKSKPLVASHNVVRVRMGDRASVLRAPIPAPESK